MTIVVSPKARDDLREAFDYIQSDNPEAAHRMLARTLADPVQRRQIAEQSSIWSKRVLEISGLLNQ